MRTQTGLPRDSLRDLFRLVLLLSREAAVLVLVIVLEIVAAHVANAPRCPEAGDGRRETGGRRREAGDK